jgi:tRNA threonylcarbamoyladenosine biosynthesis protein TsaB
MRFAALETSTDWCSVALWSDGEITAIERRAGTRHSELALPMLERLAKNAGMTLAQLDAVAFGAGPGSFTGLRIACGLAQGIAFARGIPVLGVSSLEAIAEESGAERVIACVDARMREVYYSALQKSVPGWEEVVPVQCVAPHLAVPPPASAIGAAGWAGCGNGFAAYPDFLKEHVSVMKPEIHPSAAAVARLAAPRLAAGQGVAAALAAPIYVRDKVAFTSAEVEMRRVAR